MTSLILDNIVVEFHRRGRPPVRAVAGASLQIDAGEVVGLVGETGCGKSTLARAAVGLVPLVDGAVTLNGSEVKPLRRRRRSRDEVRVQLIFQDPTSSLNPRRKVGKQVADGVKVVGKGSRGSQEARVFDLLKSVGLPPEAAERYPHEFSGGQKQRIAIARVLAADPEIVLADEPFASLDSSSQAQVLNLLVSLCAKLGLGLLLITHNLAVVRHIAASVAVMYLGLVVEVAPTSELWDLPLHPYTEALIASVPTLAETGVIPPALPGSVPDPSDPPPGCRFHPRCPYAFDRCRSEPPPLVEAAPGRRVACWLHEAGRDLQSPSVKAARHSRSKEETR